MASSKGKETDPVDVLKVVADALAPLTDADKRWVLQSVATRWSLAAAISSPTPAHSPNSTPNPVLPAGSTADVQSAIAQKNARAFMRIKKPQTDIQRVTCLGYFHAATTGTQSFASKDIDALNTAYGGTKINLHRSLDNALRRSKYLAVFKGHEKQLTPLGEDVVDALPDQGKVAELDREAHPRAGRKGRRKGVSTKP